MYIKKLLIEKDCKEQIKQDSFKYKQNIFSLVEKISDVLVS